MLLAQIHTDLFQPGEAVAVARPGHSACPTCARSTSWPTTRRAAPTRAALAFFGMEDWALELAQQSFYPYRGGSHLFLADCYAGEFNKNSALYQGSQTPWPLAPASATPRCCSAPAATAPWG
jgi:hypothetical protein